MSAVIEWKHDDLAVDLAAHLRGYAKPAMIWTDMQLGPAGSPRPDVYTIEPTYQRLAAMAYEIKISRADFLRDVQAGKYATYLTYAGAVTFAVPKGLVAKAEIPAGCGMMERSESGWRWAKKPTINALQTLPRAAWMKLLIDGAGRDQGCGLAVKERSADRWRQQQRARKLLGEDLAKLLADRDGARHRLEAEISRLHEERDDLAKAREQRDHLRRSMAESEVREMRAFIRELAVQIGMPEDAASWQVIAALRKLTPEGRASERRAAAGALRRTLREIEQAVVVLEGGAE